LSVEHGEAISKYTTLKQHSTKQKRTIFKDLALLIIIDDISMVSTEILLYVDLKMQEMFRADILESSQNSNMYD
jgi:hypothetical protein